MATTDENIWVREASVKKLTNQKILSEIPKNDWNVNVRQAAVKQLDPKEWDTLLLEIQENDENEDVRKAAKKKAKIIDKITLINLPVKMYPIAFSTTLPI